MDSAEHPRIGDLADNLVPALHRLDDHVWIASDRNSHRRIRWKSAGDLEHLSLHSHGCTMAARIFLEIRVGQKRQPTWVGLGGVIAVTVAVADCGHWAPEIVAVLRDDHRLHGIVERHLIDGQQARILHLPPAPPVGDIADHWRKVVALAVAGDQSLLRGPLLTVAPAEPPNFLIIAGVALARQRRRRGRHKPVCGDRPRLERVPMRLERRDRRVDPFARPGSRPVGRLRDRRVDAVCADGGLCRALTDLQPRLLCRAVGDLRHHHRVAFLERGLVRGIVFEQHLERCRGCSRVLRCARIASRKGQIAFIAAIDGVYRLEHRKRCPRQAALRVWDARPRRSLRGEIVAIPDLPPVGDGVGSGR